MKIKDVKENMENLEVEGEVVEKGAPYFVDTRYGPAKLAKAVIKDDTGSISINFWRQQADQIKKGDKIKVTGAFVRTFKDQMELNVGGKGKITVVEKS